MKKPSSFLLNTTTPAGRANGQAINDPGGDTGTGMDEEIYNDPAYAVIAPIESYKDGGISDADETTLASDMRDALEEMTERRITDSVGSASVAEWVVGTAYAADGLELVTRKGYQFVNFSNAANTGNDPLTSPTLWFKIPKSDILMDQFYSGEPISGGLSVIADRAHAKYRQYCDFGRYRLGGNGDDFALFSRVALDGTVVTGTAALEDDIFHEGDADEYWNLDIIAPDVLGTRTMLDMGEYIETPQSDSGNNDTMGEVLEDRFQGFNLESAINSNGVVNDGTAIGTAKSGDSMGATNVGTRSTYITGDFLADGTNGTPRTGLTTRPKELTVGISYIIVMNIL